jgi:hypothetical protein
MRPEGASRRRRNGGSGREVQSVPDGFRFYLNASEYSWITVVFVTKDEAEAAHKHAAKAVEGAKALRVVSR